MLITNAYGCNIQINSEVVWNTVVDILSQSERNADAPAPKIVPAVLQNMIKGRPVNGNSNITEIFIFDTMVK